MKKIMKKSVRFVLPFKGGKFNWLKFGIYAVIGIVYLLKQFDIITGDVEGFIQSLLNLFGI